MYPVIPLGPISLPTAPILALLAGWLGLDVMARLGKRLGLNSDDLWNFGLLCLVAGFIVARLWHVVQFWGIYREEPLLALSIRPGGLALWPGLTAAAVGGYGYLIWRQMDPVKVAAALSVGLLATGAVLNVSAFLTGATVGTPSDLPWALPYFEESRHAVALYRAAGLVVLAILLVKWGDFRRPGRVVLQAGLGYSLLRLVADAFLADAPLLGQFRRSQVVALLAALVFTLLLARPQRLGRQAHDHPEESVSQQGGAQTAPYEDNAVSQR